MVNNHLISVSLKPLMIEEIGDLRPYGPQSHMLRDWPSRGHRKEPIRTCAARSVGPSKTSYPRRYHLKENISPTGTCATRGLGHPGLAAQGDIISRNTSQGEHLKENISGRNITFRDLCRLRSSIVAGLSRPRHKGMRGPPLPDTEF